MITSDVGNRKVVPPKTKNKVTIWLRDSISGYICQIVERRVLKKDSYIHVYNWIIHNQSKGRNNLSIYQQINRQAKCNAMTFDSI